MTIQDLGAIGEFLGLFAILATLFYLARQTHQSVDISKAESMRLLVNQFNANLRLTADPLYLPAIRQALISYRAMDPNDQARASVILIQWVNFYEQIMYSQQSGLVPAAPEEAVRAYVLAFLITPGGAEFWEDFRHVFGAEVSARLDSFLAAGHDLPSPITETYPWLKAGVGPAHLEGESPAAT